MPHFIALLNQRPTAQVGVPVPYTDGPPHEAVHLVDLDAPGRDGLAAPVLLELFSMQGVVESSLWSSELRNLVLRDLFSHAEASWGVNHWALYEDLGDTRTLRNWSRLLPSPLLPWVSDSEPPTSSLIPGIQTYQHRPHQVRAVHIVEAGDYLVDPVAGTVQLVTTPPDHGNMGYDDGTVLHPGRAMFMDGIEADTYLILDGRIETRRGAGFRANYMIVPSNPQLVLAEALMGGETVPGLDIPTGFAPHVRRAFRGSIPVNTVTTDIRVVERPEAPTLWERIADDADDNY